jgi:histidine triad (HIT) family protein
MEETLFDRIISHEIPAEIVYEDEHAIAFLDIHPNNPGHTLVVPKKHSRNLFDVDEEYLTNLILAVQQVAIAVRDAMGAEGVNIAMNNEAAAGQEVFHTHMHVIPRFKADGFKHFPQGEYKPGEAQEVADKIRAQLK